MNRNEWINETEFQKKPRTCTTNTHIMNLETNYIPLKSLAEWACRKRITLRRGHNSQRERQSVGVSRGRKEGCFGHLHVVESCKKSSLFCFVPLFFSCINCFKILILFPIHYPLCSCLNKIHKLLKSIYINNIHLGSSMVLVWLFNNLKNSTGY